VIGHRGYDINPHRCVWYGEEGWTPTTIAEAIVRVDGLRKTYRSGSDGVGFSIRARARFSALIGPNGPARRPSSSGICVVSVI